MAIGDQNDVQNRLTALTPNGWFPNGASPILQALYAGFANALSYIYSLFAYLRLQTRIATATDGFLDLIAQDYLGTSLTRAANQSDDSFRTSIQLALFRPRVTRAALIGILEQLTGQTPTIIEPQNPSDCGGYGTLTVVGGANVPDGYSEAGFYGSLLLPYQAFVRAYLPINPNTLPNIAGYRTSTGCYYSMVAPGGSAVPSQAEYVAASTQLTTVSAAQVYAAINSVRPVDAILWTNVSNAPAA